MTRFRLFLLLLLHLCSLHSAQAAPRVVLSRGWQFIRQDMAGAWEVFRPVEPGKPEAVPLWTDVCLPHCFNATDAVSPYVGYYQGAGWYRNVVDIDTTCPDGRIVLDFAGAGQKTQVYVYTRLVARHTGGYDRWQADITEAVRQFARTEVCRQRYHGRIPIAVRCDNGRDTELIPSDMSDFHLYGGLYRPVSLVYLPSTAIRSAHITTGRQQASVRVSTDGPTDNAVVQARIVSPQGQHVGTYSLRRTTDSTFVADIPVSRPRLWDVDHPERYTCIITLASKHARDTLTQRFGWRQYEFRPHGPFMLNGRRLLLRGTHRHEDHAGVGAAMTDEQITSELTMIKRMGANFIRLGHYQQADRVLELCDSLGLLVWEEIPWCRGGLGGQTYRQQARDMLTHMISQHYNHPSIILWGLGNENDWPGDFDHFDKDSIRAFMTELHTLAHRLDPSRKTTLRRCDFCADIVDVYSPSIWPGWYSRSLHDYRQMTTEAITRYPYFVHAEWGGDSHAGRHSESDFRGMVQADRYGDWSETYMVRLYDWCLKEQLHLPRLTGTAFWTFKDFATPLRPLNPIPYVNQKGVVERNGTPKESYYVFQSYWATEPMIHIYGHSWPVRWGREGEPRTVLVYSNCDRVELWVNGRSYGIRQRHPDDYPAAGFHWDVPLRPGTNTLRVVGHARGRVLTDEITQEYQTQRWGPPAAIRLSQQAEPDGTVTVTAWLTDGQQTRCLDADSWIEFDLTGDGELLADLGTSRGSRKIQAANGRAAIRLRSWGESVVSVKSPGLPTQLIHIAKP